MRLALLVRRRALALVGAMCAISAVAIASQQPHPQSSTATAKPPTILFLCPHGAAKSVLASAYFQRAAKERGLNVHVMSAGTDPDPQVAAAVASHLRKNGYELPIDKPRRATAQDVATADVVISIGCDLRGLPAPTGTVLKWDDVPAPSEDFARADEKIRERVIQLVEELVRKQRR